MSLFSIAFAYLRAKWSNTLLHGLVMALGVALMTGLLLFGHQMKERLYRDGTGIDVVIGAKGSPLQLILSSVQHLDIPTGNIPLAEAERLKRHPQVKQSIPISLGDTYKQFRIVGSTPEYLAHFNAQYAKGQSWEKSMQVVIGARVAEESGLKPGDQFVGSHGLVPGGDSHADHPYTVTGILQPTGTVLDRLIVTPLQSVWDVHAGPHENHDAEHQEEDEHHPADAQEEEHHAHEHDDHEADHADREVTALLVTYRTRAAALTFPRTINQQTSLQAASPAFEMARLVDLVGIGTDSAMLLAGFLITVSLANVLVGLVGSIRERRYDLAVFRTLGASRYKIMMLVLIEGMTIAVVGSLAGLLLGHGMVEALGQFTAKGAEMGLRGFLFYPDIWLVWGVLLLLSLLACLIPAWEAYKTDIHKTLSHG